MKKTLLVVSLTSIFLVACNKPEQNHESATPAETSTQASSEAVIDGAHTAENSLDWNGQYQGTLPCADCEGIQTELKLNPDKSYELKETYLGKGDAKAFESKGSFAFDAKNTSVITLDKAGDERKYFVAEGHLKALDMEGKEITGDLAGHYELQKVDN